MLYGFGKNIEYNFHQNEHLVVVVISITIRSLASPRTMVMSHLVYQGIIILSIICNHCQSAVHRTPTLDTLT